LSRSLQVPLAALVGAITGVVAMLFVQSHTAPASAPIEPLLHDSAPVTARPPGLRPVDLNTDRRLSALELQLRELSHPGAEEPPRPSLPEKEAAIEHARQLFAQRLADHEASTRDSRWAAPKERAIADNMRRLASDAHHSFSVLNVDCRTTMCVARLQWPDEATARAEIRSVVQDVDVDCARQVMLAAPSGESLGYQASLLFDCAPSTD